MRFPTKQTSHSYALLLCIILTLIASFGLHAIQIGHIHPGHHGQNEGAQQHASEHESGEFSTLAEYMHASEKKLYLFLATVWTLGTVNTAFLHGNLVLFVFAVNLLLVILFQQNRRQLLTVDNYITFALARGILNPKLY